MPAGPTSLTLTRTRPLRLGLVAVLVAALAACQGGPVGPVKPTTKKPTTKAQASITPSASPSPTSDSFVGGDLATNGGAIVGNNGGGIISDNGASLIGKVKAPAGIVSNNGGGILSNNGASIISDNGASIVSNNGGSFVGGKAYRVQAIDEQPVAGVKVALVLANGELLKDAQGAPITTTTAADGSYKLPYAGGDANALVVAILPNGGEVLAFVPKGKREKPETLDLDTVSTLSMGYVLARYVQRTQSILERMPAELEAETRRTVAAAVDTVGAPSALTPAEVVARVEGLRRVDATVDDQMEKVRKALLAGLSDQGVGKPALDVEISPIRALRAPTGEVVWADNTSGRVFKKDAQGKIAVVAGTATIGLVTVPKGDGGPATEASLTPAAIAYTPDGTLVIADNASGKLRRIDARGTIATFASLPEGTVFTDLEGLPDGTFRAASPSALWSIDATGAVTLLAGEVTAHVTLMNYISKTRPAGDGGPPAAARFGGIQGIGADPKTGDTLIYDYPGRIRRIGRETVTLVAGTGATGPAAGDGGPATAAVLSGLGDVAVDASGRFWVADGNNHRVRRIEAGTITTVAGTGTPGIGGDGGPATQAQIGTPGGIGFGAGREVLLVADGLIRRFADEILSTEVGALALRTDPRPPNEVQLAQPDLLAHEPATDAILIADTRHVWRWRVSANTFEIVASRGVGGKAYNQGGSAKDSYMHSFLGLTVEPDGKLLYSCIDPLGTGLARVVRQDGDAMTTVIGETHKANMANLPQTVNARVPFGARLAKIGDELFVTELAPTLTVYGAKEGGRVRILGGRGPQAATEGPFSDYKLAGIGAFGAGPDGALYVGDNGRLVRIDVTTGAATLVAGRTRTKAAADGVPASEAAFSVITAVAWDAQGRLHLADGLGSRIWRVESGTGALKLVAGTGAPNLAGPGLDESLSVPTGLAFDTDGDLYVADRVLHQVKRIPADRLP